MTGLSERNGAYMVNFFSSQPALNYGFNRITADWQIPYTHPNVQQTKNALQDVMLFWLEQGCDGFRVDMADSLVKNDDEKTATMEIWRDMLSAIQLEFPQAAFISEWSHPERALNCGFHADFYLDHEDNGYHALFRKKDAASGKLLSFFSKDGKGDIRVFADEYDQIYAKTKDKGFYCFITCNHDTPRLTRDFTVKELILAYAFIFSMPGVPFLYYGDEIGMRYNVELVSKEGGYQRTGTRTPMQWDSSLNLGFSRANKNSLYLPLDESKDAPTVESQENDPNSLLNHVKRFIQLRHDCSDLQLSGDFEITYAQHNQYPFVYRRGKYLLGVNPSLKEVSIPESRKGEIISQIGDFRLADGVLWMSGQSFFIVELD
jgi:maltose alpha-D-glucosyltransferase/alpha-amylase